MSKNNPLITVGIRTYNTNIEYFKVCMEQVLNQTYNNLDILIVDDGSTKEFCSLLKEYEKKDDRIRLILKERNSGVYDTMDTLIHNLKGDLTTIIDSDDFVEKTYISDLFNTFGNNDYKSTIICCPYAKFRDEIPSVEINDNITTINDKVEENALLGKFGHSICAKLIPSSFFDKIVINEDYGFDDAQLVPQVAHNANTVILSDKPYYFYRQRSGSIMHTNNKPLFQAYKTYLFYLDVSKENDFESTKFLEEMILLQSVKLCAVNYNNEFSTRNYKIYVKQLKNICKKYGYLCSDRDNKQIKLAIQFPVIFKILFNRKRKKDFQ